MRERRQRDRRYKTALVDRSLANLLKKLKAIAIRHADVGDDNVRDFLIEQMQRVACRRTGGYQGMAVFQHAFHQFASIQFIIDDQHFHAAEIRTLDRLGGRHVPVRMPAVDVVAAVSIEPVSGASG